MLISDEENKCIVDDETGELIMAMSSAKFLGQIVKNQGKVVITLIKAVF